MDQVRALRQPYLTDEGVRAMPAEVETEQAELLTRAEGAAPRLTRPESNCVRRKPRRRPTTASPRWRAA